MLKDELGNNWHQQLEDFDRHPLAAASIGQVHRAILKDGTEVAMKIQVCVYNGILDNINRCLCCVVSRSS